MVDVGKLTIKNRPGTADYLCNLRVHADADGKYSHFPVENKALFTLPAGRAAANQVPLRGPSGTPRGYCASICALVITTGSVGTFWCPPTVAVGRAAIFSTTSIPLTTLANTA